MNLSPEHIKALIKTIALKYNVVPYHNFTHAFSVFQVRKNEINKLKMRDSHTN